MQEPFRTINITINIISVEKQNGPYISRQSGVLVKRILKHHP